MCYGRIIQQVLRLEVYAMKAGYGLGYSLRVVGYIALCTGLAMGMGKTGCVCLLGCRELYICLYLSLYVTEQYSRII